MARCLGQVLSTPSLRSEGALSELLNFDLMARHLLPGLELRGG